MAKRVVPYFTEVTDYDQAGEDVLAASLLSASRPNLSAIIFNTALDNTRIWNGSIFVDAPIKNSDGSPDTAVIAATYFIVDDFKQPGAPDDSDAIDAAIAAAFASTSIKTIKFLARTYTISRPIILARIVTNAYNLFNLDLVGAVNANAGVTNQSTKIVCTFSDTFAIGIQNARSVTIENIFVLGTFTGNKAYKFICESQNSDWAQEGVRDSQFSPYSAITVDPFGTSVPADGGYPGLSDYYKASAGGSSAVTIKNCSINNFVVGLSVSNNGVTPNAEAINIYNSRIYNCKIPWASGQSQTRGCVVKDCAVFNCLTVFDGVTYGGGFGSPPVVENIIVSTVKNFCNVLVNRGTFSVKDVYAEAIWKIGVITGTKTASFTNSTFKFEYGETFGIKAPDSYITGGGAVNFYACDFTKSGDQNYNSLWQDCTVRFDGCSFESLHLGVSGNGNSDYDNSRGFGIIATHGNKYVGTTPAGHYGYTGPSLKKTEARFAHSITHTLHANQNNQNSIGLVTVTTTSDNEATFTAPDATKIRVGDIIQAVPNLPYPFYFQEGTQSFANTTRPNVSPVLGTVKSVVGTTITIKDTAIGLVTADFQLINLWTDVYYGGMVGTTTNGSNVITNVYRESSASIVGKRIYQFDGAAFPLGLYVVSEDQGARTITLSGDLNASHASIFLYTALFNVDAIMPGAPPWNNGVFFEKGQLVKTKTDKLYLCTLAGITGNGTHTPTFKEVSLL